jgi:hypothetical protein
MWNSATRVYENIRLSNTRLYEVVSLDIIADEVHVRVHHRFMGTYTFIVYSCIQLGYVYLDIRVRYYR